MKYHIRLVNTFDPEIETLLVRMQRECLPGDAPLPPYIGYWWIAYTEDGQPAAFASMKPSTRWQQTGYLSRSGVLLPHRGRGLQKRLIRVRTRKAKDLGWLWLLSDTSQNPESSNSLISCGFRMYEPREPYGLDTSIYWRKKL